MKFKFFIYFLGMALAGCSSGSGKNGMPTSLTEHAKLVCKTGIENIDKAINSSQGQQRDELKKYYSQVSNSDLCSCTVKTVQLGQFRLNDQNYNVLQTVHKDQLPSVYESLKKYKLEETLPMVQLVFNQVSQDMLNVVELCASGFNPDTFKNNN